MRNRWVGPLLAGALAASTLGACVDDADDAAPTATPTVTRGTTEPTTEPSEPITEPRGEQRPTPDLESLADAVVAYALGAANTFPHAPTIALSIGGEPAGTIDVRSDRDGWRTCPGGWEGYAAASCPVDLLGPVRTAAVNDAQLVFSREIGEVTCAPERTAPPPPGRRVVLRLVPELRSCATDFALALVADRRGRLAAVDLTLSNP